MSHTSAVSPPTRNVSNGPWNKGGGGGYKETSFSVSNLEGGGSSDANLKLE